jgi:hypothetical protein
MVETCPVQCYPNKQAMPADKVSSPEQLCNTLCAVKGQGECEGQGDQRMSASIRSIREFVEKRREAATMK